VCYGKCSEPHETDFTSVYQGLADLPKDRLDDSTGIAPVETRLFRDSDD
jgi:hypothetical protein